MRRAVVVNSVKVVILHANRGQIVPVAYAVLPSTASVATRPTGTVFVTSSVDSSTATIVASVQHPVEDVTVPCPTSAV